MADKPIGRLNPFPDGAEIGSTNTLFAAQYSSSAYKLNGLRFVQALAALLDGHGGIKKIQYVAPTPPSLTGKIQMWTADMRTPEEEELPEFPADDPIEFPLNQGKGIASIAKIGTSGLVDTYRITYNDATTSTFTVTNGQKGDTGDAWYVWIRYASRNPITDSDISTIPDNWMGIYSGTSSTAPTHYTDYTWYQYKGEKGDTGDDATISSTAVEYQQGTSGTVVPSGTWTPTVPAVSAGNFLWTRTTITFTGETPIVYYSVGRMGIDGSGAVSTVNSVSPDGSGNVDLTATDIPTDDNTSVQSRISDLEIDVGTKASQTDLTALETVVGGKASQTDLTALETVVGDKANTSVNRTISIAVSDWVNKTCTKPVTGVTASNNIIVAPDPTSFTAYGTAQIRATAQAPNSVTFECEEVPESAVTVNICILG